MNKVAIILGENSYILKDADPANTSLYELFSFEFTGVFGADSWLDFIDDPEDEFRYGNISMAFRIGDKICIKSLWGKKVLEDGDVCMPERSFRRLLLQMERAYIEMPEEIAINWHENGSATFDWESTCTKKIVLQAVNQNHYVPVQSNNVSSNDLFAIDLLNLLLRLVFLDDSSARVVIRWLRAIVKVGKNCEFEGVKFEEIENEVIISRVLNHSNGTQIEKIVTTCFLASMMISHAVRIIEEKPTQVLLKWYEDGFAFEWERDGDV